MIVLDQITWTRRRIAPLRDLHAADLLERTAQHIDRGADVTPEPYARRENGNLKRTLLLHLPWRRDLEVSGPGARRSHPRVNTPLDASADPAPASVSAREFTLASRPFQWQAAELFLRGDHNAMSWAPLRLWALEWMQPRQVEESPDLLGAIHALSDPEPAEGGVRLRLDFGSAPASCLPELLDALSMTGSEGASLGPAPEAFE